MDIEPGQQMIINPAQQVHDRDEIEAATQVIESGFWAEGPKAEEFRRALGEYLGVRYVTLVNSGSSANLAGAMALTTEWIPLNRRLGPWAEVITPALCFPTTVAPIRYSRATPVFVDVDETWGIDINQVVDSITNKTRAIIMAHNLGNPVCLDALKEICEKRGIYLIEDNCDALGAEWNGKKTGSIGDLGTSSFYPAHHISSGEGGAVYTNDPRIFRAITTMVNWGRDCYCGPGCDNTCGRRYGQQQGGLPMGYDHKNTYSALGFNLKMTDIQAAILTQQLKKLPGFIEKRNGNHAFLSSYFQKFKGWFDLPKIYNQAKPSWFGYVIKLTQSAPFNRDDMVLALDKAGIRSRAFFCGNITRQPALWNKNGYRTSGDLSRSDEIMNTSFWIGVHPRIGESERLYMTQVLDNFLNQYL